MNIIPWEEYQKSLPKKRMSAGLVIWDKKKRLLLVKPNYEDRWLLPGGVVEENESPRQAAERETIEEIGLKLKTGQLLAVSYNFRTDKKSESLQWIFYGGILDEEQIKKIRVDTSEIEDFCFADNSEIDKLTKRDFSRRMKFFETAIKTGHTYYLEDWKETE